MQDEIDNEDDDEQKPWWRQLLGDAVVVIPFLQVSNEWWPRDNWQHWAVYPIALLTAGYVFERGRDFFRRLRARRNAPTIDLSAYRPVERKGLPPSH